jgi:transcriptional regulator with GAF, ATPase, and Fis domain
MVHVHGKLIDYTADLGRLTALLNDPAALDELLAQALRSLRNIISYDLAAIFRLHGESLVIRAAEGPLAGEGIGTLRLSVRDFPSLERALASHEPVPVDGREEGWEGGPYHGLLELPHGHACMLVPLYSGERSLGVLTLDQAACGQYSAEDVEMAGVYGQIISLALIFAEQTLLLDRYRHRLEEENRLLREEVLDHGQAQEMLAVTRSSTMRDAVRMAQQVARSDMPVLIEGETGTGKEVLARAIHSWSPRLDRPFVKLNCAAIPENLVESELFGHVKGAFSGAVGDRPGRFVTANGGTLFLDEIGDMPLSLQSKLLRVLQEGTFEALGSDKTVRVDVRVIAATHLNLREAVQENRFREDLYYRLAGFPINLPPLRERVEDILPLSRQFLADLQKQRGIGPWTISSRAIEAMVGFYWPGNVRQLVNTLERATILQPRGVIEVQHLALEVDGALRPGATVSAIQESLARESTGAGKPEPVGCEPAELIIPFAANERHYLTRALECSGGRIYGPKGAARMLGMPPTTLQSKLRKHGLR